MCTLVDRCQHWKGTCCLRVQGRINVGTYLPTRSHIPEVCKLNIQLRENLIDSSGVAVYFIVRSVAGDI
jgi:hypothetical protein